MKEGGIYPVQLYLLLLGFYIDRNNFDYSNT